MANEKRNPAGESELNLQEVEIAPPAEPFMGEVMERIATEFAALPFSAQLAILRLVTPVVLEALEPSARQEMLEEMTPDIPPLH